MVIAGATHEVGSHRDEVERQIVKLRRDVDEGPAVTLGKQGGQLKVEIGPGRASGEYDVLLVTFDKPHLTEVALGENRRSEEHTSELQSLMHISYAVFCLKKKK